MSICGHAQHHAGRRGRRQGRIQYNSTTAAAIAIIDIIAIITIINSSQASSEVTRARNKNQLEAPPAKWCDSRWCGSGVPGMPGMPSGMGIAIAPAGPPPGM